MLSLDKREQIIIEAIQRNYHQLLDTRMVTHFSVYFKQSAHPEKIYSWIEAIEDIRLLSDRYLDSTAHNPNSSTANTITNNTNPSSYLANIVKTILPERISKLFFDPNYSTEQTSFSSELVSLALGNSITGLLFDYFKKEYIGNKDETQKQFAEMIEKNSELSYLIKKECERLSVEIIKLFHFREMLLLGKISLNTLEPDARSAFILKAHLQNESFEEINSAIEVYYARELSKIFNQGFQGIYQVQDFEIKSELRSPFLKWLDKLFDSAEKRLAFTQEIQLKFMQLSSEFLLEQMNQPGFFAKNPKTYALISGLLVGPVVAATLAIIFGGPLIWGMAAIALVGFALASISTYFLITKIDRLLYQRTPMNRAQIQQSIDMVNNEFLRLQKEIIDRKDTSTEFIKSTKNFEQVNQKFMRLVEGKKVARGSVSGWLREYASRYRHSKAIEVDLGDEYKELIIQSKKQTKDLITSINNDYPLLLSQWITDSQTYISKAHHQEVVKDFELIQKIKEQVLEIVSQIKYIPPTLLHFYCLPLTQGGLAGNESDFAHIRRLAPNIENKKEGENPYSYLCETAQNLFKKFEPLYASSPIFYGDAEYRQMLGIPRGDYGEIVSSENIDSRLKNSYAFLLSLCQKVRPGLSLDPLIQQALVTDEFILYRMLLLKQLSTLCSLENKEVTAEFKTKIKAFIHDRFNIDPNVILDDLANQRFLLNKEVQTSFTYKNKDGFMVTEVELDNITQAIGLDIAYNSMSFQLKDVLDYYVTEFLNHQGTQPLEFFAYNATEQELNPQATQQFVGIITRHCYNTATFLQASVTNNALITTNILDCYRYNVSLQVYRTQLRIAKCLAELNTEQSNIHITTQSNYLCAAFLALDEFAKSNSYPLKINSALTPLFQLIETKASEQTPLREWINQLNTSKYDALLYQELTDEIHYPPRKRNATALFFNPVEKEEADKKLLYRGSLTP